MLVIISDLHLGDGTCGNSISHSAFRHFASQLQELAYSASWRDDGTYQPLRELNILLLGDIIDPIQSTHWLEKPHDAPESVRPWTDYSNPAFAKMLRKITRGILRNHRHTIDILFNITKGKSILLPPAIAGGQPDPTADEMVEVNVKLYYMVGNHDWLYHIQGEAFDEIRQEIIDALGLANPKACFPHDIDELPELKEVLSRYKVYARHGDIFDSFNYDKEQGRDYAALSDVFVIEVINRFFIEVEKEMGDELPAEVIESIKELTNVRPLSASLLWVSSLSQLYNLSEEKHTRLKNIWDRLGQEFLKLDVVRERNKRFSFGFFDALFLGLKLSNWLSFDQINKLSSWLSRSLAESKVSMMKHALKEKAFIDKSASYIVYGHTHHQEIIPLDVIASDSDSCIHKNQFYMNTGSWHTYYDLALYEPTSKRFVSYQTLSYLIFYRDNQRGGQRFETWSGTYS